MKLLAYCIVSHDRPGMLLSHLASISSCLLADQGQVSLYIFDNSTGVHSACVRDIAANYGALLLQEEGCSATSNFLKISSIERHHFCMLAHDDDSCYISDLSSFLSGLLSASFNKDVLAAKSVYIDDDRLHVSINRHVPLLPLYKSVYPWRIPAFPAWIFPMDDLFLQCFEQILLCRPAGKYSDVSFIDSYLSLKMLSTSFSVSIAPGITYLYRCHADQDSRTFDLYEYFNMLCSIKGLLIRRGVLVILDLAKKVVKQSLLFF